MTEAKEHAPPVRSVDLTGEVCPMTFMKARLVLSGVEVGDVVELTLKKGDQMQNVPRDLKAEGHRIEDVERDGELFHLSVRKGG